VKAGRIAPPYINLAYWMGRWKPEVPARMGLESSGEKQVQTNVASSFVISQKTKPDPKEIRGQLVS
jgi:hypothetical protein